jgi:translation elongation factor EF-1alpha
MASLAGTVDAKITEPMRVNVAEGLRPKESSLITNHRMKTGSIKSKLTIKFTCAKQTGE